MTLVSRSTLVVGLCFGGGLLGGCGGGPTAPSLPPSLPPLPPVAVTQPGPFTTVTGEWLVTVDTGAVNDHIMTLTQSGAAVTGRIMPSAPFVTGAISPDGDMVVRFTGGRMEARFDQARTNCVGAIILEGTDAAGLPWVRTHPVHCVRR